jgi:hypothetical protein
MRSRQKQNVSRAELVPTEIEKDGKKEATLDLQGGHTDSIFLEALKYSRGPPDPNAKYRLAGELEQTTNGKEKAKTGDGKKI